jgi:hypothetical protein
MMSNSTNQPIHIFWDNSNIYIAAQHVATEKEGILVAKEIRIHFDSLYQLARAGRQEVSAFCVGSIPPEMESMWNNLRSLGIEVGLLERGANSGSEQGVDQWLQVRMLRALSDADKPGVAVLLTGDGAGYDSGAGFHADLERMQKKGWGIEVLSWNHACNKRLKKWAEDNGVFVSLDDYFDQITFRGGTRKPKKLSLLNRAKATPK